MSDQQTNNPKKAFVAQRDRPEVKSTRDGLVIVSRSSRAGAPASEHLSNQPGDCQLSIGDRSASYKGNDKWKPELTAQEPVEFDKKSVEELFELVRNSVSGMPITESANWSGAFVVQQGTKAGFDPAYSVWATWVVPKVKPPERAAPGEWHSASWVGLDGGSYGGSRDVLQAGIDQDVTLDERGHIIQQYSAWYGWDSGDDPNRQPAHIPVDAGDLVYVKVDYQEGKGLAYFMNYTQDRFVYHTIASPGNVKFKGDTAEWIMERPYRITEQDYYLLADFGVMEFIHCGGLTKSGAPIILTDGFLCEMVDRDSDRIVSQASQDIDTVRITWKSAR